MTEFPRRRVGAGEGSGVACMHAAETRIANTTYAYHVTDSCMLTQQSHMQSGFPLSNRFFMFFLQSKVVASF